MHTFAQNSKVSQQSAPVKAIKADRAFLGQGSSVESISHLQRAIGNYAVQRMLQIPLEEHKVGVTSTARHNLGPDFSRIPVNHLNADVIQTKLSINKPGDEYEQEADRVAARVMRMSEAKLPRTCGEGCPTRQRQQVRQAQIQTKPARGFDASASAATSSVENIISSPGQSLGSGTRAFFEPRFGYDFSQVRVHTDSVSAWSARNINALAYTSGDHIVFGRDNYQPDTLPGRELLAHELTHVIQQKTDASRLSQNIQRQVPSESYGEVWGETLYALQEQISCLQSLFDEMDRQTRWFLRIACRDGNYFTSTSGVRYIPEDRADAFGHCWIGCQGAKICGQEATRTWGESYEVFREAMRYLTLGAWGHNSYEEDTFNQRYGRELARGNPEGDCSDLCYQAVVSRALRFHGHHSSDDPSRPRVYNCSDITIDGHRYHRGWRTFPMELLDRF